MPDLAGWRRRMIWFCHISQLCYILGMNNDPEPIDFIERLKNIRQWSKGGNRAPHKPLLLLLALGRAQRGDARLATFAEWESELESLLKQFGSPSKSIHPEYPFGRLCNDDDPVWEVPGIEKLPKTEKGDLLKKDLREKSIKGGFLAPDSRWLSEKPDRVQDAAELLLTRHFPESLHDDIRRAVGLRKAMVLRDASSRARYPRFRDEVLRNYEYRCAVCGFDIRIGNELLGLKAAHIKWHAFEGPDTVDNGLALCGLHHKALDKGAWGLEPKGDGYGVLISSDVRGQGQGFEWLRSFHGRPLRSPLLPQLAPKGEYVDWHANQVFRAPALP